MANQWYRVGTATLTTGSTAVTGVGTLWSTQVLMGDLLTRDGSKFYEVLSVTNDLSITLRTPYLESAETGVPYAIVRNFTGTLQADIAASLANLIYRYGITLTELQSYLSSTADTTTLSDYMGNQFTVGTIAGTQRAGAAIVTSATAKATEAANSATAAANSATTAANSATSMSTSVANAASSATSAANSATAAAASATSAAMTVAITTSANSATAAAASAAAAASSASSVLTSETNAASSAAAALASKNAAAASAAAAATLTATTIQSAAITGLVGATVQDHLSDLALKKASSANPSFTGVASIHTMVEAATIATVVPATIDFDIDTQGILFYGTAATANCILNIRASATKALDAELAVGQSVTVTLIVKNTTGTFYPTIYKVDGVVVTPKWSGGIAPVSGSSNATDVYSYTVIKTGNAQFEFFANQSIYA